MKKHLLSITIATAMCISLLVPNQCVAKTIDSETEETFEISDDVLTAKLVARTFIASIADNNGWDVTDCIGEDFTTLYNLQNEECGYIFKVNNGTKSKGYITVGNVDNAYAIIEYAFENNSINELTNSADKEKIYLTNGFNYIKEEHNQYITQEQEIVSLSYCDDLDLNIQDEQLEQADKLLDIVGDLHDDEKEELWDSISAGNSGEQNTEGGVITSISEYLKNYVGSSYTFTYDPINSKTLSGAGSYIMTDLDSETANCCTLVALCNAMIYYRNENGYSSIPSTDSTLYSDIKSQATKQVWDIRIHLVWG